MENELLNCPFCGGEAEFYVGGNGYIQCTHCLAMIPYKYGLLYADGKRKAIAAWNRRTQPENKQYEPKFCTGCRSVDNDADDYPCNECRRAYTDKFEPKQEEK